MGEDLKLTDSHSWKVALLQYFGQKKSQIQIVRWCSFTDMFVAGRGLLSNSWKWLVQRDTHADKVKDFMRKWCLDREQAGKGTQEDCSATWLIVLGFMVMRWDSSYLWPIILLVPIFGLTQSFLVARVFLSQGRFQHEVFWEVEKWKY